MNAPGPIASVFQASRREVRYLLDTPAELLLMTLLPCVLLGLLAWLLSSAVIRDLPIAVVDQDRSSFSRELVHRLDTSPGLQVSAVVGDVRDAWSRVRRLDAYAVVLIPPLATRDLFHDGRARITVYYNASFLTPGQGASRDVSAVVAAFNARLLERDVAKMRGGAGLRPPPISVQGSTIANSQRSFEHYLLGLLFPGVLHLMASLGMVSALGREVRDGTLSSWLAASPHPIASLLGKLVPYVALFWLLTSLSLAYLSIVRGGGVSGSVPMLMAGMLALYLACAGVSLLLVGALRDMGTALSMCGLYVGTALAFSGATFPVIGGALFTRVWNALLPLTAYLKLQAQQVDLGATAAGSARWLAVLIAFFVLPGAVGIWLLLRHARSHG